MTPARIAQVRAIISDHTLANAVTRIAALFDALAKTLIAPRLLCDVCWTASFEPVEQEVECVREHPHEGEHMRCAMCWSIDLLMKQRQAMRDMLTALAYHAPMPSHDGSCMPGMTACDALCADAAAFANDLAAWRKFVA